MLYATTLPSPVGELALVGTDAALTGLWLERRAFLDATAGCVVEDRPDAAPLRLGREWIAAYFAGRRPSIDALPLAPGGTPFRQLIWRLLRAIPYGECVTYGELARAAARALHKERMSSRAVGGAVGRNPLSIIIPCHRVVGAGGNLTGYGGGIARKIRLLELEGVDMRRFSLPRHGKYAVL
ncbi:methylated-DNA--[protein]-cysteine S-methyltransferase [Desulfovibrio sp.]|uniref:methylated-DNA--[protein]-cysteine S-methyltransferase n=1 Tax=Desulfovibrio sp. TaxID=885 RepID=UPI0023C0CABC|nr:methylated-DNA--[protein]-cysteine S-methyltransferase [Desulfovibrio sp.]MDE7240594.1 methylated-DNA--[protein]-cysteine S-methyltransferase [Desulfovibrio sp.]